jgi:hypothetical protein
MEMGMKPGKVQIVNQANINIKSIAGPINKNIVVGEE